MRRFTLFLFALCLCWSTGAAARAQEKPAADPKPAAETEQPKNEVDRALEEAKARSERVMTACLENCEDAESTGGLEVGRALELGKPTYPAIARAAHVSGEVVVRLIIGTDGTVIAAAAISGHPLLMAASVKAARESRFTQTTYLGEQVKVVGEIKYNFVSQ